MTVVAILQARASSTRLPGKVMLPLLDKPMLERQIERVLRSSTLNTLIIATSENASDDAVAALAKGLGLPCYRGSLDDVLDRFYQAALTVKPSHVVRLTGDCPLADPDVIDRVVQHHLESGADYTSNVCPPTYPDGLDVEVMTFSSLESAWRNAQLPSEREHVTSYIRKPEAGYKLENVEGEQDLSHCRWTVDEQEDFDFVSEVYRQLYAQKPCFTTKDVLTLIEEKPELASINQNFERNEGYTKSLLKD
ncbi:cytidylyltransferase domain-containing protein [Enterovibrio paralichthyis]|uniref:cytidylyltransferase domain-containing protein n=1 Tax=Enterovibrio paralichthyis TaxID=2853805 RepID=UPI001C44741D|nr:glycosyltransferase family protein [Enterovibrio paralichthyis]MBV7298621.1 glycosyltransferase family protein [Enterovibrio paralichthyis]